MPVLHFDTHRRHAFIYLLSMVNFGGLYFFVFNTFFSKNYSLALIDLIACSVSILILILLLKDKLKKQIEHVIRGYLCVFYLSILLTLQFIGSLSMSIYLWVFLVPPLSYLLLGRIWGLAYTITFIIVEWSIFYERFWNAERLDALIPALSDVGFCLSVVWILTHIYEKAHTQAQETLIKIAYEDSLTGLLNRSALNKIYEDGLEVSIQNNRPLSIMACDIDWFKRINDTYGHDAGDKALSYVARVMTSNVRSSDSVFRLGGEEFCICLPKTDAQEASRIAEVIRSKIERSLLEFAGEKVSLTISVGIAMVNTLEQGLMQSLKIADQRMYQAKKQGRNQVVSHE